MILQVSYEEAESMVGRAPLNPMQRATGVDSRGALVKSTSCGALNRGFGGGGAMKTRRFSTTFDDVRMFSEVSTSCSASA